MSERIAYAPHRLVLLLRCLLGALLCPAIAFAGWTSFTSGRTDGAIIVALGLAYFCYLVGGLARQLADRDGLILEEAGFSFRRYWTRRHFAWWRVSEIKIKNQQAGLRVMAFDDPLGPETLERKLNKLTVGMSHFIVPHVARAPLEEVVATMNAYRERALQSGVRTASGSV